ncbi:STAS domain-containing protein [Streptomyces misionensis]|uniref:STAS domain-containing protein n=1 Tax=Streptomyces misionensis TaxID=67331 RepID=UPI0033A186FD
MSQLMSSAGGKRWSGRAGALGPVTTLEQYERDGAWVVAAHGSFDLDSIPPLADALGAAVKEHPKVVLDASGVAFGDSSFLNLLILTHQTGTLRVAGPPEQLRRLFAITGADTVLEIRGTVADAAAS